MEKLEKDLMRYKISITNKEDLPNIIMQLAKENKDLRSLVIDANPLISDRHIGWRQRAWPYIKEGEIHPSDPAIIGDKI